MASSPVASSSVPGSPLPANGRRSRLRLTFTVLRRATENFVEDGSSHQAAAISYFALFSLFPIILLAFAVFGLILRDADVQARVLANIVEALPIEQSSIANSLESVADLGPTLGIFGLIGTIWTASALITAVRRGIADAFDDDVPRPLLRGKLIDYTVLPVVGLLFLSSIVLTGAWRIAQEQADYRVLSGSFAQLWDVGAIAIPAFLSFVTFLFLYWILPNQVVRMRHVWPGALLAALAFEAVKLPFSFYLANFADYEVVYGSLGGVIVLLFWIYLSANIVLFGAQVAAETPHVLRGEARHGHVGSPDQGWWPALFGILRGLVFSSDGTGHAPSQRARRGDGPRPDPTVDDPVGADPAGADPAREHSVGGDSTVDDPAGDDRAGGG